MTTRLRTASRKVEVMALEATGAHPSYRWLNTPPPVASPTMPIAFSVARSTPANADVVVLGVFSDRPDSRPADLDWAVKRILVAYDDPGGSNPPGTTPGFRTWFDDIKLSNPGRHAAVHHPSRSATSADPMKNP